MLEDQKLLGSGRKGLAGSRGLILAIVLAVMLSAAAVAVSAAFGIAILVRTNKKTPTPLEVATAPLPRIYRVAETAWTPVKDQGARGTCWVFSTLGWLEASYRSNGFKKGLLKEDEYVTFAEQAYAIGSVRFCQDAAKLSEDEKKYCSMGGSSGNTTDDGQPEFLYTLARGMKQYVVPEATCAYNKNKTFQWQCEALDTAVAHNPLKFEVKGVRSAYTIDGIKRLMMDNAGLPLTWASSVPANEYFIPCDELNETSAPKLWPQCRDKLHSCAISADGLCAENTAFGEDLDGVFNFGGMGPELSAGGHAMMLLGWNDELSIETGEGTVTTGGFIIKNSWGGWNGHSAAFLASEHSIFSEEVLCPLEIVSKNWLPLDSACFIKNPDNTSCAKGLAKNVRGEMVSGPTVLKLKGEKETPERYYVAMKPGSQLDAEFWTEYDLKSGHNYFTIHMVKFTPETKAAELITLRHMTWSSLSGMFSPVSDVKGNAPGECGVWFMPYQVFQDQRVLTPPFGHDTPCFSTFDVEWSDDSYLATKKRRAGADYTLLEKSTTKFKHAKFASPLDHKAMP